MGEAVIYGSLFATAVRDGQMQLLPFGESEKE